MKISVLHSNNFSPNEIAFLSPLHKYQNTFKKNYNIKLSFSNNLENIEGDIALLSSKYFSPVWGKEGFYGIKSRLLKIKEKTSKIFWCDISDSTGTTHFMVLPLVDGYLKNQIFADKRNYLKKYYGSRIYSDFIHHQFAIDDTNVGEEHLNFIPDENQLDKIKCSWNSGFAYYGRHRFLQNYLFSKNPKTQKLFKVQWVSPNKNIRKPISCRVGITYSRNTIAESRKVIREKLAHLLPTEQKLSHKQYLNELAHSVCAISPFGLGEISLRDFEATLQGAAIIKQDMSPIETWPNLWIKEKTYLAFAWDMSDLEEKVKFSVENPNKMREYAKAAQEAYRGLIDSKISAQYFCQRFKLLVE